MRTVGERSRLAGQGPPTSRRPIWCERTCSRADGCPRDGGCAAAGVADPAFATYGGAARVAGSPSPVTPATLAQLTAAADAAMRQAQQAADGLETAAARTIGLRLALERVADAQAAAQDQLGAQARDLYENAMPSQLAEAMDPLTSAEYAIAGQAVQHLGTVDEGLVARTQALTDQLHQLAKRADAVRRKLLRKAIAAETAADSALRLLDQAQEQYAAQQAAAAAIAARRAALEALSAQVTAAVAVRVGPAGRAVATAQAPIIATLEAAGPAIPQGYAPTSTIYTGVASWYGPGFVGNPTSSGAPYDPERLTCAMLVVPLGAVVHVEANGLAVNCLVNDHGPYVDGRLIDMSRAGSRALGYDGLAAVRVTVLTHIG